jgi:hypothetical protein
MSHSTTTKQIAAHLICYINQGNHDGSCTDDLANRANSCPIHDKKNAHRPNM